MKTAVILILAAALWPSALLAQQTPPAPTPLGGSGPSY